MQKIYTRAGENGETASPMYGRVKKSDLRVQANVIVDQLNSLIGYVLSIDQDRMLHERMIKIQRQLITLSQDIAVPLDHSENMAKIKRVPLSWNQELESETHKTEKDLLDKINPCRYGESQISAALDQARVACKHSEKTLELLQFQKGDVNPQAILFIRRLSRYLFSLAMWVG